MMRRVPLKYRSAERATSRRGFTVVELLVVIAILSILAGLIFAGIGAALNSARESQTKTLVSILDGVLRQRQTDYRTRIVDQAAFPFYSTTQQGNRLQTRFNSANGANTISANTALHFAKKSLYASVFPQRFQDLCGFDGKPGIAATDDNGDGTTDESGGTIDLGELGSGGAASDDPPTAGAVRDAVAALQASVDLSLHTADTESAELLYLCLTNPILPDIAIVSADQIPQSLVADTDGDGLLEFVDGWERPLRFYTFTTGLMRPTSWTWGATAARPDVTSEGVLAALTLTGQELGLSNNFSAVSGTNTSDATHQINRDIVDDKFGAVLGSATRGVDGSGPAPDAGASLLADPNGFGLAALGTQPAVTDAPNLPITLGTVSFSMIVSAGPDEVLGLEEPAPAGTLAINRYATPTSDTAALFDNITNFQGGPK